MLDISIDKSQQEKAEMAHLITEFIVNTIDKNGASSHFINSIYNHEKGKYELTVTAYFH